MRNRDIDRMMALTEARERWAAEREFAYSDEDVLGLGDLPLAVLNVGAGRSCDNLAWGHWKGIDVVVWDLRYWQFYSSVGYVPSNQPRAFSLSCAMVKLPRECPRVILTPGGRGSTFGRRAARKLDLTRVPMPGEIDDQWRLYAQDEGFGTSLAHGPLGRRLQRSHEFGFEIASDLLVAYARPADPAELEDLLDLVLTLRTEALPSIDGLGTP